MVGPKEIKRVMSPGELAVRIDKRWVSRNGLVQQIDRLQQILSLSAGRPQKKILGARVEIECADVARRRAFDGVLFSWRKLCLQLIGDRPCNLALNGEYVSQIAVIRVPP